MGKKHTKSEKLDLILSELSELKEAIKKLSKIAPLPISACRLVFSRLRSERRRISRPLRARNLLKLPLHQSQYWFRPLRMRPQVSVWWVVRVS